MLGIGNLIALSLMAVLSATGTSARSLMQDSDVSEPRQGIVRVPEHQRLVIPRSVGAASSTLPCGIPLPGLDIVGENIGSVAGTSDPEACYAACMDFPGCIGAIRVDANGACFFKSVDIFNDEVVESPGLTSFVRCDFAATEGAQNSTPVPVSDSICDTELSGQDIPGDNLSSLGDTPDLEACIAACEATPTCNAAIRVDGNGGCFFKSVDVDTVQPFDVAGLTAYLICTRST